MDQNQESVRVEKEAAFSTTHWTMILAAGEGDSERKDRALASLCKSYWYPIYAFVRREGHSSHDAQDVTQGFFARLLSGDGLQGLNRTRGRFRSFLLASLKNYLTDLHRRSGAEKRGGKSVTFSIDDKEAEARFNREPSVDTSPDKLFERLWVVTLLEPVMAVLSEEQKGAGKGHVFENLQHHISKEPGGDTYRTVAEKLGISEEAVKKAVQRLRQRYGFLLRSEIANTVSDPELVEEELSGLLEAWQ